MTTIIIFSLALLTLNSCAQKKNENNMITDNPFRALTPEEERVIVYKGTEMPNTGKYNDYTGEGIYTCKRCDLPLYKSEDKFPSHCGWPSFDDEINGAVKRQTDTDGQRTEILCANCGAHLGHVFLGEGFTDKNTRHCVNSISLNFYTSEEWQKKIDAEKGKQDTAYFASGCFWGTEYHFERKEGVLSTEVGYTGGTKKNPTYKEVCTGTTGHAETTRVIFNPEKVSYEDLVKLFFETHDPTQFNRQGPDVGTQYRSEIFYLNEEQKNTAEKLKVVLESKGFKIATKITAASVFWLAEEYHQQYYTHKGSTPYCHIYTKRFD
ncbi:MAG: bifunctional methionine sulfoxide reductase B/A protein [Bacteroidales bacterium]|nr:bifunctional methionine sulfoxide reductase B/A protein [Bacteroidales bacterium]